MGFAPIGIERKEQREDANRRKEGSYGVVTEQEIHDGREHPNAGDEIQRGGFGNLTHKAKGLFLRWLEKTLFLIKQRQGFAHHIIATANKDDISR